MNQFQYACVRWSTVLFAIALLLPTTAQAQTVNQDVASGLTVKGTPVRLPTTVRFDADKLIAPETSIPYSDLIRIDFPKRVRPQPTLVVLTNGDQLPLAIDEIEDEKLTGRFENEPVQIPLEFISAIGFHLPETDSARKLRLRHLETERAEDTVGLKNNDELTGEISSINPKFVTLESVTGAREISSDLVNFVQFSKDLQSPIPTDRQSAIVQTDSGLIITASDLRSEDANLRLNTMWGDVIRIKSSQLISVLFIHARILHLSEVSPKTSSQTPFIGAMRQWRRNRNVNNGPLQHASRRYVRGIGTASRSEITWTVAPEHLAFHTAFGIDQSGPQGAAKFEIRLDNKVAFASEVIRASDGLKRTPTLSLKGVCKLTLIVDFGPRGDLQDYANWIDPVLLLRDIKK
jgi:hypothetical protein